MYEKEKLPPGIKKAVDKEVFVFLLCFLGFFVLVGREMGVANMFSTLMNTAYQLLLDTVCPDVAVFSVGADNSYGHPTQEAMDRFLSVGAQLYRTDLNGTVTITARPGSE